ncbi:MAG: aminomethyl-transferring glycine dehydrogenase [Ignavibacteria bacterium]|nr:aminomethyl-transferring glycine dehydrogenase [Ignavibacteria bacterium]
MDTKNLYEQFSSRHIGPNQNEINEMLKEIGVDSLEQLVDETIPENIRFRGKLNLAEPLTEFEYIQHIKKIAAKNKVYRSYIGLGYYGTVVPSVIKRNILENPGWYTQYTPYQAEISQGRLEALMNFQTMISDLTKLPISNASLLDEGTACGEAMSMLYAISHSTKPDANIFLIDSKVFPQTIDVVITRATPHGIIVKVSDNIEDEINDQVFGMLVQYPDGDGEIRDYSSLFAKAKEKNVLIVVAADIMSLVLLKSPAEFGADVIVGSTQRFGVPMGYGGPHAAYFATKDEYKRFVPGRIIGLSIDRHGDPAYRMALQTREQHIKREKATSNICTAQVLLAIMASMYAVYHGPDGLKRIANRIHLYTNYLNKKLIELGYKQTNNYFFDTIRIDLSSSPELVQKIKSLADQKKINFNYFTKCCIGISLDETVTLSDLNDIIEIFSEAKGVDFTPLSEIENLSPNLPEHLIRTDEILPQKVFNSYHTETEMMRYIKMLEQRDLSLAYGMIPLGSCTMKLNAATEMLALSMDEFANIHPFVPAEQAEGYYQLIDELGKDLLEITGFSGISFQPNSGAQGEFTGLMVIRAYHHSRGEAHRNVVLIPASAHGTNPASAVMAGNQVVVVKCDESGNIDINDLKQKAELYKDRLSSLMVTYPSTHGVFEEEIQEICEIIHYYGGQVYMDGANLNAQVGLTKPKLIGADVCHLNLHKTFAIPHGGGGPGMGPIVVAEHLVPFLPNHHFVKTGGSKGITAVASAPFGSASILTISHAYIKMMGPEGLTHASKVAILNANYIKAKLEAHYKVLYTGKRNRVGHELIFDVREFKQTANIEVEDIAKRLMDYGFHAPTVSFPVPGTLMVEPTESESKKELDRFCDAMIQIREEIKEIEIGEADREDNLLRNAPHTLKDIVSDEWNHKYSRERAVFPTNFTKINKFWPFVARVNNAYGDRNLVCTCDPIELYMETQN